MKDTLGEIVLKLSTDDKEFISGLSKAEKQAGKTNKSIGGLSSGVAKFGIAAGAAAAAIFGVVKAGQSLVSAYEKQEIAERKLSAALRSTGNSLGLSKDQLIGYANSLQAVTTYSNDAIVEAEGMMTTFTKVGKNVFPQAIESAMDMSQMFGQDLKQSIIQLGTALNDPIQGVGRLRRIGVSFTQSQKDMIKTLVEAGDTMGAQKIILGELRREFGGVAREVGKSGVGKMAQFKNALDDVKKIAGKVIVEGLSPLISNLTTFLENGENVQKIATVFKVTGAVIVAVVRVIGGVFRTLINWNKILYSSFKGLGKMLAIIFNPRNWFKGKMKAALDEWKNTVTGAITDAANNWADIFRKTRKDFENAFKTDKIVVPIAKLNKALKTTETHVGNINDGLGDMADKAKAAAKEIAKVSGRYEHAITARDVAAGVELKPTQFKGPSTMANFMTGAGHGSTPLTLAGHGGGESSVAPATNGIMSMLGPALSGIGSFASALMSTVGSLSSVKAILDPMTTILSGVMEILTPIINKLLAPLQGILLIIGNVLGKMLAPILEALTPIIEVVSKAFVWLYNNAIRPFANMFIKAGNMFYNFITNLVNFFIGMINGVIRMLNNALGWAGVSIRSLKSVGSKRGLNEGTLGTISYSDLVAKGTNAQGNVTTPSAGGAGNIQQARPINIQVYIKDNQLVGSDGFRELALILKNEFVSLGVLGL